MDDPGTQNVLNEAEALASGKQLPPPESPAGTLSPEALDSMGVDGQALFLLELGELYRRMWGVTAPIPQAQKEMFCTGWQGLSQKYDFSFGEYAPEITFGMACLLIVLDTETQVAKVQAQKKLESNASVNGSPEATE